MARIFYRNLREGYISLARGAGTLIGAASSALVADNAVLSDVNIPITQAFDATGYDTVFLGVDIAAGTAPTMTLQLLFRDSEAAVDSHWRKLSIGAREGFTVAAALAVDSTGALGPASNFIEMRTFGHRILFPYIQAVGGTTATTTGWVILVKPGRIRPTTTVSKR